MFKSVKYVGFENHPDLRARAERAMPVVEDELGFAADRIAVTWQREGHEVELVIDDGLLDRPARAVFIPDFLIRSDDFRQAVRHLHLDASMGSLHRSVEQMRRNWPAEAGV